MARMRRSGGSFGKVLLGFVLGAIVAGIAGFAYLKFGHKHASTANKAAIPTKHTAGTAPKPHFEGEPKKPPFGISEDVFEAGAHVLQGTMRQLSWNAGTRHRSGRKAETAVGAIVEARPGQPASR